MKPIYDLRFTIYAVLAAALMSLVEAPVQAYPGAPASQAAVNAGTEPYLWVTPKTMTGLGVTTNDPLAAAYIASASMTDASAMKRLANFCLDARRMAAFTNLQRFYWFDPLANPSNHIDLFGNAITWSNDFYGPYGAIANWTNVGNINLNSPTGYSNWTLVIWKANPWAGIVPITTYNQQLDVSLESSNADAFSLCYNQYFGENFPINYQGQYSQASNWNNTGCKLTEQVAAVGAGNLYVTPPQVWTICNNGGTNVYGWNDLYPILVSGGTNLAAGALGVTNFTGVQKICLFGSTNFSTGGYAAYGGSETPTNGAGLLYALAFFNTAISSNDACLFYTALHELPATREEWFFGGDSMVAEGNNRDVPNNSAIIWTNFTAFYFMQTKPGVMWHDVAQGGSTLSSFATYGQPNCLLRLPSDEVKDFVADWPRNDVTGNGANSSNFMYQASNTVATMQAWVAPNFRYYSYETPLAATNSDNGRWTTGMQSNLISAYLALRTNAFVYHVFNTIDYQYGSKLSTNSGLYGYGAGWILGGTHIEGTNTVVWHKEDASFWTTGIWGAAPYQIWSLPFTTSDYSGGLQTFGWVQ